MVLGQIARNRGNMVMSKKETIIKLRDGEQGKTMISRGHCPFAEKVSILRSESLNKIPDCIYFVQITRCSG